VLSNRLFSQLLQGANKFKFPKTSFPSLLQQRATEMLARHSNTSRSLAGGHRSEEFNKLLLPHAEETITAVGHALAYDAASKAGVDQTLLDMYLSTIMHHDPAWFITKGGFSSSEELDQFRSKVVTATLSRLEKYLDDLRVARYVTSPLVTVDGWKKYLSTLNKFSGNAVPKL
jgi:acyl-CoA oxidase